MVKIQAVIDKAKDVQAQAQEKGKETMQAGIESALSELQSLRPILNRYGFSMGNIAISLGLPPNIVVSIKHDREAASDIANLEADSGLTNVQSVVVKALKNAYGFTGIFQKYGYVIGQLNLELGLIPGVGVVLNSVNSGP